MSQYLTYQGRAEDDLSLRRTFVGLALSLAVAFAAALWVQAPTFDPLDRVALPLIAVFFGLLTALMYWGRLPVRRAIVLGYASVALYLLLAYYHQFQVFVPVWGMLSQNTYGFAALYVAAYLAFPPRLATQLSSAVLGVVLGITLWQLLTQPQLLQHRQLFGSIAQFLAVGLVITVMQARFGATRDRMQTVQNAAFYDALTAIANRRAAEEHMQELYLAGSPYTLVLFDIDHFKGVNDEYGHATGDRVLIGVAQTTQQVFRDAGLVARWGGEEFLLVLCPQPEAELQKLLEELRRLLKTQPFGLQRGITACFGVAHATPAESPEAVIHRADTAMYFVKKNGRDGVKFWAEPPPTLSALT